MDLNNIIAQLDANNEEEIEKLLNRYNQEVRRCWFFFSFWRQTKTNRGGGGGGGANALATSLMMRRGF